MEVLVGPTFSIDVSSSSSSTAYVMDRAQDGAAAAASCLFLNDAGSGEVRAGFGVLGGGGGSEKSLDVSSASSSSIGEPGDSDDEEDEVSSKPSDGDSEDKPLRRGLGSLGSLEDSLPIKRGLSNHFSGKSKSFANLSEMSRSESTAKDLEKLENPLNKRRRVLIACRWSKKSSFYGWHSNPNSMPLLPSLAEDNDDDDPDDEDDDRKQNQDHPSSSDQDDDRSVLDRKKLHRTVSKLAGKRRSFKSQSCFALADLHREEDEDHDYQ